MALQTLLLLVLGQVVSFNLAISSFTVSLITNQGVDAPLTLSFFTYLALALVYGTITLHRRQKFLDLGVRIMVPWYWYLLLGFVDVQGNFLVTKAYEYTSITSVTILDCWTIAWVIILTWLVLGTRYSLWQFFGAGVCLGGLALVLLSDYKPGVEGGSKPLFGDTRHCRNCFSINEQCWHGWATLERKSIESINWSPQLVLAYVGCTISSFMFYSLGPFVLKMSGATLFNLSLLTSDMEKDHDNTQVVEDASTNPEYTLLHEEIADIRNCTLVP
ncbi:hypothetical protein DH2020_018098 [Rehmannia glutinosa]|uniref:Uncharacterized protein n=1 Tax=Rehmannia glutinosa TaxID=99300 RepID=A0ABR0WHX7_REHGL